MFRAGVLATVLHQPAAAIQDTAYTPHEPVGIGLLRCDRVEPRYLDSRARRGRNNTNLGTWKWHADGLPLK